MMSDEATIPEPILPPLEMPCPFHDDFRCERCKDTGMVLTDAGREIVRLVVKYMHLAVSDE
jgi:hypothetical protein